MKIYVSNFILLLLRMLHQDFLLLFALVLLLELFKLLLRHILNILHLLVKLIIHGLIFVIFQLVLLCSRGVVLWVLLHVYWYLLVGRFSVIKESNYSVLTKHQLYHSFSLLLCQFIFVYVTSRCDICWARIQGCYIELRSASSILSLLILCFLSLPQHLVHLFFKMML